MAAHASRASPISPLLCAFATLVVEGRDLTAASQGLARRRAGLQLFVFEQPLEPPLDQPPAGALGAPPDYFGTLAATVSLPRSIDSVDGESTSQAQSGGSSQAGS